MNVSHNCYNERERERGREKDRRMEVGLHNIIHGPLGVYHMESVAMGRWQEYAWVYTMIQP